MKSVWITYSWDDNKEGDIDFIAQEISKKDIDIKLDRWNLQTGKRLWEQIDNFISNEEETDAWIMIASSNSLGSEKCKEEYYYALERALEKRGSDFPIITIFLSEVDKELIPTGIKIRLYASINDSDWIELRKKRLILFKS